jgi:mono/diheme cytochrome c family protein
MTGRLIVLVVGLVLIFLIAGGFAVAWKPAIDPIAPPQPAAFDEALVRRGAELAAIGNCITCHTAAGGSALAGGRALPIPFGTIYSSNITPDPDTGIGRWSEPAFQRAMREGVDRAGHHLYPAFPYNHFTLVTEGDNKALYAYLMTRDVVTAKIPENTLRFPYNLRIALAGWKLLFLRKGPFEPNRSQSEAWNRGAYLVEGLGHCGACHTPRNALQAERRGERLAGGEVEGWTAYALNHASPAPMPWDQPALAFYLKNGWHPVHGIARGPMAEVTQNLASASDADVQAIATYIASAMGEPSAERKRRGEAVFAEARRSAAGASGPSGETGSTSAAAQQNSDAPGALIYASACAVCHESGRALPFDGIYLALSTAMYGPDPKNLINVTMFGLPGAEGEQSPIMPGFAGALTDAQLTALVAYLRQRFSDQPQWQDIAQLIREARSGERSVIIYPTHASTSGPGDASQRGSPW